MKKFNFRQNTIVTFSIMAMLFSIAGFALGGHFETSNYRSSFLILTKLTSQDKLQEYRADVQQ